ncbi:hypothetical protein PV327_011527, partial [Microctonus hyperodae]
SQRSLRENDPDFPPLNENNNPNSGVIPINEIEKTKRRVAALARDLDPMEIITLLDVKGLNCRGSKEILNDRLIRFELRREHGEGAAEWSRSEDERSGIPRTCSGWQAEPSVDELVEDLRSSRLNASRSVSEMATSNIRSNRQESNKNRHPESYGNELETSNRFELRTNLPTGQSIGPYRDPILFEPSEDESSAQCQINPSGNAPPNNNNRIPQVTFADGFRLASSPMVPNYRANSTRIIDT